MAVHSGSYHNQQWLNEYDTAIFSGYGDVAATYDEPFPSLADICNLFLSYNSNSPSEEEFSYGSIDLPYWTEVGFKGRFHNENGTTEADYEQDYQPFISCGNWLSGYNIYSNGSGEEFPHYGYYNNGHDNDVEKPENIFKSDEWCDNYYEDTGKQLARDYNFWDGHWSKFGDGEEDPIEYGRQELKPTHSNNQDEMRFCEDIFGYWPCSFQRIP